MFKKLASAACLVSSTFATINVDYAQYISGEKKMDYGTFETMWDQYTQEVMTASNKDDVTRKQTFGENVQAIIEHNLSGASYMKGINKFTDLTEKEFQDYFNLKETGWGEDQHCSATDNRMSVEKKINFADQGPHFDWREHHGVSPVKNQGHCGSCWTFSTVGALEAHTMIKYHGDFTPLSEQQLVDCAGAYDNHGCNGGLPSHAFEYIQAAGGISTETDYPYYAEDRNCTVNPDTFALKVWGGSVNITEGDEQEMASALVGHGPVSIAFQVVDGFRDYTSGIYTSDTCKNSTADVNHAVLAVGFGTCPHTGMDYWIVKNSWGADWGDEGYFKIERGVNMCGVAVCNSFPQGVSMIHKSHNDEYFLSQS